MMIIGDVEESYWLDNEPLQLESSRLPGEKILCHGPIDMLDHSRYVHCKLVSKGGE